MTHKTKATGGGRQWENTKHKPEHHSDLLAGGQCDQCAGLLVGRSSGSARCHVCNERIFLEYSLRYFSRANAHGANFSGARSFTAFLRCFFLDEANCFNVLSVIVDTCNPVRHSSPHHGAGDGYSCSLALRRWRYSTSRFNAAVTNCPVLSPGIFTASTLFITSCGTLAATVCDFAFTAFVAMLCTPYKKQMQYAGKKISVQHLTCLTPRLKLVFNTLLMQGAETTKPGSALTLTGLLTTNDSKIIEVAMGNHTTHPQGRDSHNLNKYIWRFIALSTAQPRVIHIVATSEQEARQQSPDGCVMVFAARIRQEVRHVQ
ncbi:TPA: host cell division inhibitor Icd-like protein [Escherichia coli]|nr:host cell division inhibitor Icd-like protein [Escherichia coli]